MPHEASSVLIPIETRNHDGDDDEAKASRCYTELIAQPQQRMGGEYAPNFCRIVTFLTTQTSVETA